MNPAGFSSQDAVSICPSMKDFVNKNVLAETVNIVTCQFLLDILLRSPAGILLQALPPDLTPFSPGWILETGEENYEMSLAAEEVSLVSLLCPQFFSPALAGSIISVMGQWTRPSLGLNQCWITELLVCLAKGSGNEPCSASNHRCVVVCMPRDDPCNCLGHS